MIPNIWKNKKCSKPPTSDGILGSQADGFPRWCSQLKFGRGTDYIPGSIPIENKLFDQSYFTIHSLLFLIVKFPEK